jgi:hypothetical protein
MENDICSTVYWYQTGEVRPFTKMPDWKKLLPGTPLARSEMDLDLPDGGTWIVDGPYPNHDDEALNGAMGKPLKMDVLPPNGWKQRSANHGFVDFNHAFRPHKRGVGVHHEDVAANAFTILEAPRDMTVRIRVAWDDRLVLRVNDQPPIDMGQHDFFRLEVVPVELRKGPNDVMVKLSNTRGLNHGGWTFAFQATAPDGEILLPSVGESR